MRCMGLAVLLLLGAGLCRAGDPPPCDEPDPLDCASPEDFLDIPPGMSYEEYFESQKRVPPEPAPELSTQPSSAPSPLPSAAPAPPVPLRPSVVTLAPVGNFGFIPAAPEPVILLGVYSKEEEKYPRTLRASLEKGQTYVVEAKCPLSDMSAYGRSVTFNIDAENGMEYFERDGIPMGAKFTAFWEFDPASKGHVARAVLRTVTMTTLFKPDTLTASCPGLSDGKLNIDVFSKQPKRR